MLANKLRPSPASKRGLSDAPLGKIFVYDTQEAVCLGNFAPLCKIFVYDTQGAVCFWSMGGHVTQVRMSGFL